MSEFWVSEGRHWCKYCKKWISSNKIQIQQHESGEKHIEAEEEFVKNLSSKVSAVSKAGATPQNASRRASAAEVSTGELLERIAKAQARANAPAEPVEDENAYPAPAEEVLGPWVAVHDTPSKDAAHASPREPDPAPRLRVGATDEADEEEALAREAHARAQLAAAEGAGKTDEVVFRARGISKAKKRRRRGRK